MTSCSALQGRRPGAVRSPGRARSFDVLQRGLGQAALDSGKLRALGVTSRKRRRLPDVPSIEEAGIKDYEVLNWFGMFAPIGTPAPIIARIYAEVAKLFAMPEIQKRLAGEGADIIASTPADFAKFVKAEIAQWSEVGRAAKIQPTD